MIALSRLLSSPRQRSEFFGQLGTLLDSGIPLGRALPLVAAGRWQRPYWQAVAQHLDQGADLGTALEQASPVPPLIPWHRTLLKTAEQSGALAEMCRQLGKSSWDDHRRDRHRRSVLQSLLSFLAGVTVGLSTLAGLSLGVQMLLLVLILGGVTIVLMTPQLEALRQELPIVGKYDEIRFTLSLTELALPLRCGLSVLASLDLLNHHLPPGRLKSTLQRAAQAVSRGLPLSQALGPHLPSILKQYIRTGEESGSLETMLDTVAQYCDQELETLLNRTQGILKPLSILGLGAIVCILGIRMLQQLLSQLPG